MLFLHAAAGGAEIANAKVVGLDACAERGFNVLRQVAEPEVCERAAAGADQMVVARGVVVAVGRARLRQADELAVGHERVEIVIHSSLRNFRVCLLHLQKNLLGGRVLGGAQDEVEDLPGIVGHMFLLE